MNDPLLKWREEFPILENSTYLVNHSLGAMPRKVWDRMKEYADTWATRGIRAWSEGWWSSPVDTGNLLADIFDAPHGSVVMHQNVSVIQGLVASCLDFTGERNRIVYTGMNFPTVMYVWEAQKRHGAEIVEVPSRDGVGVELEDLLAAIDERTLLVPISHVLFQTGYQQDLAAVIARAHEVGALVVADCYQSTGTVPFSVRELGVDMVCGGSVKWLCGGPGAAYLYVRPDLQDRLQPRVTGWAAHAAPFAFEQGEQRHATGIERFLHGSPAVAPLVQASAGYEAVLEAGVHAIRDHSQRLLGTLEQDLLNRGFTIESPTDPARRGGTLTVGLADDEDGPAFVKALEARDVLVDHRPEAGIRVSPHFYTLPEELAAFAETLTELRETRRWQDFVSLTASY